MLDDEGDRRSAIGHKPAVIAGHFHSGPASQKIQWWILYAWSILSRSREGCNAATSFRTYTS